MRKTIVVSITAILLIVCGNVMAGGSCNGCRIKNIGTGPYYDGICSSGSCVFISMEGTITGKPACSSNSYWHFVLNLNSPSGKSTFAQLLAAQASGQSLNITGSNFCTISPAGVTEDLYFVTNP